MDRWIEVVVDSEVLTPRQIIGSVPWALIAQQANEIVPDPNAPRFEDPDGGALTDFLARLNGKFDPEAAAGCFAGGLGVVRCDWRRPEISEFQTIVIGPEAAPGQATTCPAPPCIDQGFAAIGSL